MEIILQGSLNADETTASLASVLTMFKDRYHILAFREIHMHVTLVDAHGDDVELVDTQSNQVYRIFEIRQQESELVTEQASRGPLHLVVDNTTPKGKK